MSNIFGWANYLTGGSDPYQAEKDWAQNAQKKNRAALGLDANGNPIPPQPASPDASQPAASTAAGQAAATGVMPPGQQPNATKTDPALGSILVDLQQYQEREQGFEQALGAGAAAISQPRDREWVRGIFNTTPPDPLKSVQMQQDLASQQQGQDRTNSLGLQIQNPQTGQQIADALHMPGATPEARLAALQAAYRANPQAISTMLTQTQQPTTSMANLDQMTRYMQMAKGPNADPTTLKSLRNQIIASVAGTEAAPMVADQLAYFDKRGVLPPWHDNLQQYAQYKADQKSISDTQATAGSTLGGNIARTEMLRQKISDLQNNPGLQKILALPNDSPMKIAARNALRSGDDSWQKDAINYGVLINDPQAMQAISELQEINGQEYTGAIDSLLGHGLRPSQTEVTAVREGFGQTKNIMNFGSIKDYTEQAIKPMLTRLDEAEATGYGSAGEMKAMPARVQPFIHPTYLTGGKMHIDSGDAPEPWEGNVNKPLPEQTRTAAIAAMNANPHNAFAIRDGLRRQGFVVDF